MIGDAPLTIEQVVAVARGGAQVSLGRAALDRIAAAHAVIARVIAEEQVAYGVTTGFGLLATTHIPVAQGEGAAGEPRAQPRRGRRASR